MGVSTSTGLQVGYCAPDAPVSEVIVAEVRRQREVLDRLPRRAAGLPPSLSARLYSRIKRMGRTGG